MLLTDVEYDCVCVCVTDGPFLQHSCLRMRPDGVVTLIGYCLIVVFLHIGWNFSSGFHEWSSAANGLDPSVLLPVVVRGRMQGDHAAVYLHTSHQAFLPVTRS